MYIDKVVCDYFKSFTVIHGGGLEAVVPVVVKQHYWLFGALAEIVNISADFIVMEGVPVIDDAIYSVGENEIENGLFRILMYRVYGKIMEWSYYRYIAVAFECLGDYAAEYLALKIYVAIRNDYAYKYSSAHVLTPSAQHV